MAHFSRAHFSCAHGFGKSIDGFAKQHMVFAHYLMSCNHLEVFYWGVDLVKLNRVEVVAHWREFVGFLSCPLAQVLSCNHLGAYFMIIWRS
jgi:hypothetical protein